MSNRKPKIEYYWVTPMQVAGGTGEIGNPFRYVDGDPVVNWRLVGANGETMCQSTQGYRDKTDARRSIVAVLNALLGAQLGWSYLMAAREVGPGRKPS